MDKQLDRRAFLKASVLSSAAATALGAERQSGNDAASGGLRAKTGESGAALPCGVLGDVTISRLILGGNLMGGWAHARDLLYVSKLSKSYNTPTKIAETLALAERHGVNTILINPQYLDVVAGYNRTHNGAMQVICEVHVREGMSDRAIEQAVQHDLDGGADVVYLRGVEGDQLTLKKRFDLIAKTVRIIRDKGVAAGVGGHLLEVVEECEAHGVAPDFYMKTLHQLNYWSSGQGKSGEWFENSQHDNVWCTNPERVVAVMEQVKRPWIAFKVLAAGAIHPKRGFLHAFQNGADFICVGMFDFQVKQDAEIAGKVLRRRPVRDRKRPWYA